MRQSPDTQVLVIGAGQAGLAAGYYLRRAGLDFLLLDAQGEHGGAWQHSWDSLRLFSPAQYSSLPGRPMAPQAGEQYPDAAHVVDYLATYEKHYAMPVQRGVRAEAVERSADGLVVRTDSGPYRARAVISATGTWWRPFVPTVIGQRDFAGTQLHTRDYRSPADFAGQRVAVVGAGNSGAQIAADLVDQAEVRWLTREAPRYLPDDIDGRALFDIATQRTRALQAGGEDPGGIAALGNIVAVPPVRRTRDAGRLQSTPMFDRMDREGLVWADGTIWACDAVIWATGFRPALSHLSPLRLRTSSGHPEVEGTRAIDEPRLHLLGYGDWTGPGSATLVGAGRTARGTVQEIKTLLADHG